ncbi:MAG: Gfo/Idh/MocA family oxidoreductase [Clostridia bacterium]|nr:Gfo/Idh/MocA family oxidoreductase [Clostridia bacterium]
MKKINIGIIGLGGIANKHIAELLTCEDAQIVAICDISPAAIEEKNKKLHLPPEKCYRDYKQLLDDPEVEAVEICTPNYLHAEMAIEAFRHGKHVNLEKPIAMNRAQAETIVQAKNESGKQAMTCFSYRFFPAVRYAKHLVDSGTLGEIIGVNASYLKCSALWEGRPLEWRFVKEYAGSGVIGDLGVHLIDLAQLLAGNITELCAQRAVVVKERKRLDSDEIGPVETDDQCDFIARFACGAHGAFHITRCAMGHGNTISYEVYGTKGAISFDLNNPKIIHICIGEGDPKTRKFETVDVPSDFFLDQERAFVDSLLGKADPLFPTIEHGEQGQRVVDAIIASAESGRWVTV